MPQGVGHKLRIIVRSRVPFPPTIKVFADKKKEQKCKACRGKSMTKIPLFVCNVNYFIKYPPVLGAPRNSILSESVFR